MRRANKAIMALKMLHEGKLDGRLLQHELTDKTTWKDATAGGRAVSKNVLEVIDATPPPEERPQDVEALLCLNGSAELSPLARRTLQSGTRPQKEKAQRIPTRGEVCTMEVEKVALPAPGHKPVPITLLSPRAKELFKNFQSQMLREENKHEDEKNKMRESKGNATNGNENTKPKIQI